MRREQRNAECQCQKCHSPWVLFAQAWPDNNCSTILPFSANGLVALLVSVDHLVLLTMHANGAGHSSVKNFSREGLQVKEHLCDEVGETISR